MFRVETSQSVFGGVISFEDIQTQGMLSSLECSSDTLRLNFRRTLDLETAQSLWQDDTNPSRNDQEFIAIIGKDQCGLARKVRAVLYLARTPSQC